MEKKVMVRLGGWNSHTVRSSKPLLASLERRPVTAVVKRRQSGCRVAMLISSEILQGLKGRRSSSMRKATSRYAIMRV